VPQGDNWAADSSVSDPKRGV